MSRIDKRPDTDPVSVIGLVFTASLLLMVIGALVCLVAPGLGNALAIWAGRGIVLCGIAMLTLAAVVFMGGALSRY